MKRYIIPVAAFVAGMAIVPSVFAVADGGTGGITKWSDGATPDIAVAGCINGATADKTCTLADDVETGASGAIATVQKNIVLDLAGHTLTISSDYEGTNPFKVTEGASLTITNGTVINSDTDGQGISVGKNATLTINADVKSNVTASDAGSAHIVLAAGHTLEGDLAVTGATAPTSTVGAAAPAVVEINGQLLGQYKQVNYVNGVINGSVSKSGVDAVQFLNGGTLTVNGQITSTGSGLSAIYFSGTKGALNIKCATITADGQALFVNGEVASLDIKNSTLTSKNGSTINGQNNAKVDAATIAGSHLVAKSDAKVMANVAFEKATYEGEELAENANVLSGATGSYGTLAACDAAVEPGEESENPNTADTIATYLTIATVALLGLGATAFVAKKSNR